MAINIKQDGDGSAGLVGLDGGAGEFINVNIEYNASSVDKTAFIASRSYIVKAINGRPTVAGTDGSAVTAVIRKVPSGTAIGSGTALHSGSFDLKGTANTNQALTLSTTAGVTTLSAGQSLAIDFTGTLTSATGVVTVALVPV